MKITLIGMRRQSGIASKTGNPYDMAMLIAQVPIEQVANDKVTIKGKGYETAQIPYLTEKEPLFEALTYPCTVELLMDSVPRFGEFQSVASGVKILSSELKSVSQG